MRTPSGSVLRSIGIALIVYLLGLWVGIFTGTLPLFVLFAGVPFILLAIDYSALHASFALIIALIATWVSMDLLSFVLVSMVVVAGTALAWWHRLKRPLIESFFWSGSGAMVWLAIGNMLQRQSTGTGLLSATREALVQALDNMLQTMAELGAYTAEQVSEFTSVMQQGINIFTTQWPYLVFAVVAISTITNLSLARMLRRHQLGHLDWLVVRMPAWMTAITLLSKAVNHFLPTLLPILSANIWNMGSLLLILSALSLCFYFLRHWRLSPIIRAIFLMYILTSPWMWRVLFLVGGFDSFFNYRFYAKSDRTTG